jgi:hypothetical protein
VLAELRDPLQTKPFFKNPNLQPRILEFLFGRLCKLRLRVELLSQLCVDF